MTPNPVYLWQERLDAPAKSAAEQMAIDEALFHWACRESHSVARFYTWDREAVTFGYSEPFPKSDTPEIVRRYTGGGIVEHGDDVTFLLAIPKTEPFAQWSAPRRYQALHEKLHHALANAGYETTLLPDSTLPSLGPCFQHPVPADLVCSRTGEKIAGGAQRRSRGSIIHQGSVRLPKELRAPHHPWRDSFLHSVAGEVLPFPCSQIESVEAHAADLAETRYRSMEWNQRR